MRIDEQTARCFSHLRAPEFAAFLEYVRARRQITLELLAQVTEPEKIYRLQGEVGAWTEILSNVESAEALIVKLKRN
jgi:hypothetical protein